MSIQQNTPNLRILAGGTVAKYAAVKADGTAQNGASTTRTHIGFAQNAAASGEQLDVRMTHAGTCKAIANAAITVGATVYYDANGRIGVTATSNTAIGIALTAASGAGSIIEILPFG